MRALFRTIGWTIMASTVAALLGTPALAQRGFTPGAYEARLNRLFASHDAMALGRAIFADAADDETVSRGLNWLQDQELSKGGSTLIAVLYSALLWRVAQTADEPIKTNLRRLSAIQLFLARLLIATEAFQCRDDTAAPAAIASVERQLGDTRAYLGAFSEADNKSLMEAAFKTMVATFPMRENDFWLCSLGSAQIGKYLEKHPEIGQKRIDELEGKSVPGMPGKTVVLPADPSILPDFVPYADWKGRRRARIDATTELLGLKRLADYGDASYRLK